MSFTLFFANSRKETKQGYKWISEMQISWVERSTTFKVEKHIKTIPNCLIIKKLLKREETPSCISTSWCTTWCTTCCISSISASWCTTCATSLGPRWPSTFGADAHSIRIQQRREKYTLTTQRNSSTGKLERKDAKFGHEVFFWATCLLPDVTRSTQLLPSSCPQQCPRLCYSAVQA